MWCRDVGRERRVVDLKGELEGLEPAVLPSPWPGHEWVRGYGVFGLPFDSGHVLALRVFPVNDFAPYCTVWHRTPEGEWAIHYDAPRPDISCPRYYGPAAARVEPAKIALAWRGPAELQVSLDRPDVEWTVRVREPAVLRALNAVSAPMPLWTWKLAPLVRLRDLAARALGLGVITMAGRMPSGHYGTLMPQRMYYIDDSQALFDGVDLGKPARVSPNPRIGDFPMPARGVFAIGQAHWEILDRAEYEATRAAVRS